MTIKIECDEFAIEIKQVNDATKRMIKLAQEAINEQLGTSILDKEPSKQKTYIMRDMSGRFESMIPKDDIVDKYGRIPIYGQIIDYILEGLEGEVFVKDISNKILTYYTEKFNKTMTKTSAKTYAIGYIKTMIKEKKMIKLNRYKFKMIDETSEQKELAEKISKMATDCSWAGKKISVKKISETLEVSEDKIKLALIDLFKKNKAIQLPGDVIRF